MRNERLRRAMLASGTGVEALAEKTGTSAKSVRRWLDGATVPYPQTRYRVAEAVGEDETYLWPEAVDAASLAGAEVLAVWPRRSDVPTRLWTELLSSASRSVDVLAFAGLFLTEEHPGWIPLLHTKAGQRVRVRLLLGDPAGAQLGARDGEARIGGGVAGRVAAVLAAYAPVLHLRRVDGAFVNTYLESFERVWANARRYFPEGLPEGAP
jgi:transcriptional regulator with XRE-family HTH domain